MKNNFDFLTEWRAHLNASDLNSLQEGFKKILKEQLETTDAEFIHGLCRKIDVHKKLYSAYDPSFQKALTELPLDQLGWEMVYLVLATYVSKLSLKESTEKAIGFKCMNTLLKLKDSMPEALQQHPFIPCIYTQLLPSWL